MAKPPKGRTTGALPTTGGSKGTSFDIAMSKYRNNERLSKAENELLGLYHPAGGGVKLTKLPSEYTAEYDMYRELKPKTIITPESMVGSASVPLVGDSADTGKRLISVNGAPLSGEVNLQGGSRFMRDNPDAWASGSSVITALDNQIERALEGLDKVYAPHVSMSGTGGDFNTMTTKTLLNMFDPLDISQESAQLFDNRLRTTPVKNQQTGEIKYPYTGFVGIQHPELREQLLSKKEGTGNLRKAFVEEMNKGRSQMLGFPEPAAARFATSDPVLINQPIGSTGYEIAQFKPGQRVITEPEVPHETYPIHLGGEYAGSLADTVPAEVYFKDYYEGRRLLGSPKSSDTRAFTMSAPIQYHDQAWLDNLMGFITERDAKIKKGEYAEGGMVTSAPEEAIKNTIRDPEAFRMLDMDLANLALMNRPQQMAKGGKPDNDINALRRQEEPKIPTVRDIVADIGNPKNREVYENYLAGKTIKRKDLNPLSNSSVQLLEIAKKTPDPDRYLETLNPYFDSQLNIDTRYNPYSQTNIGGYVDPKIPNVANIVNMRGIENTVPHELEHTIQLQKGKNQQFQGKPLSDLRYAQIVYDRLKAMPEELRSKIAKGDNIHKGPDELLANIAAHSVLSHAKGVDFINTPEGKLLFPDREGQSYYYNAVLPNVPSVYGYRENANTTPYVKDPRDSYATQAFGYMKEKARELLERKQGGAVHPSPEEMLIELMERGYGRN